jgi:hypothetical protein
VVVPFAEPQASSTPFYDTQAEFVADALNADAMAQQVGSALRMLEPPAVGVVAQLA